MLLNNCASTLLKIFLSIFMKHIGVHLLLFSCIIFVRLWYQGTAGLIQWVRNMTESVLMPARLIVLKELWLCVLTSLGTPRGTSSGAFLCFNCLRTFLGAQNFLGTLKSISMKYTSSTCLGKDQPEAGRLKNLGGMMLGHTWGMKSTENLLCTGQYQGHTDAHSWTGIWVSLLALCSEAYQEISSHLPFTCSRSSAEGELTWCSQVFSKHPSSCGHSWQRPLTKTWENH